MKKYFALIISIISLSAQALPDDVTSNPCAMVLNDLNQHEPCIMTSHENWLYVKDHPEIPYNAAIGDFGPDGIFVFGAWADDRDVSGIMDTTSRLSPHEKDWVKSTWILQQRIKEKDALIKELMRKILQ